MRDMFYDPHWEVKNVVVSGLKGALFSVKMSQRSNKKKSQRQCTSLRLEYSSLAWHIANLLQ